MLTVPSHDELTGALRRTPHHPFPPASDRDAWASVSETEHGRRIAERIGREADRLLAEPVVAPLASDYLIFSRTGDRGPYEARLGALVRRLERFALAECLEGKGRYLDGLIDALWLICEQTTWVWPAHEGSALPDPDRLNIDLGSAMLGLTVAEILALLGRELEAAHPRIPRRAARELERRCWTPYLERGDFWWLWPHHRERLNNWTGVCSGAILCAALSALADDPDRLASLVEKAVWSLDFFLDSFGESGSLDEGIGYWEFGVSYFALAAERIEARTGGAVRSLDDPRIAGIARFPLAARLYEDRFIEFSDCAPRISPSPGWLHRFGERTGEPNLRAWALDAAKSDSSLVSDSLSFVLRNLFWLPGESDAAPSGESYSRSIYLPDVTWMFSRSDESEDALILAVKGGHNGENHNHNDLGSFAIHHRREAFVTELGAPTYTRQFFSAVRYVNLCARSLGHPVPCVNGVEQPAGERYRAVPLEREFAPEADRLKLDLTEAYPKEAGLKALTRSLRLVRDGGAGFIELTDEATYLAESGRLALPLYALDRGFEIVEPGCAVLRGERSALEIRYDPTYEARAEAVPIEDAKFLDRSGATRIHRLWIETTAADGVASLRIRFAPAENRT